MNLLAVPLTASDNASKPGRRQSDDFNLVSEGHIGVRRLTPRECERLMGWPDDHTRYGTGLDGETVEISDSQRYRMCGNGVVATVAEWIGHRLVWVDAHDG